MHPVRNKQTASKIKALPEGFHADGGGLYIRVTKTTRYWVYRYMRGGRRRDFGLGPYPQISLAEARAARDQAEASLRSGVDPVDARQQSAGRTLREITALAFEARRPDLRGDGKVGQWMSPLNMHILPKLGDRDVTTLTQLDVERCLSPIWRTKTSAAKKSIQRLGIVLHHAEAAGLEVDPRITVKAAALLGSQGHEVTNYPAMAWQDVPVFYQSLDDSTPSQLCLKLQILTAVRPAVARSATAEQINGDIWTVPAELMKGRKHKTSDFRIPLSAEAQRVVALGADTGLLWLGAKGAQLRDMVVTNLLKRRGLEATAHGFRATFKSWAVDHDIDWFVSEVALAHSVGSTASQAYQRSDILQRRRIVMDRWAGWLTGAAADVVVLKSR